MVVVLIVHCPCACCCRAGYTIMAQMYLETVSRMNRALLLSWLL